MTDRGTGKTTSLMEEAIAILSELPEDAKVFITGAHSRWLLDLKKDFKEAGLVDVEFYTASRIIQGCLRGQRGILLIDDAWDLSPRDLDYILEEKRRLESYYDR